MDLFKYTLFPRHFHLYVSFFFLAPGDNPALHSFPTRRSSDLRRSGRTSRIRSTATSDCIKRAARPGGRSFDAVGRRDRKSTRLNSSHVAISYAVFCLKKKNGRINGFICFSSAAWPSN